MIGISYRRNRCYILSAVLGLLLNGILEAQETSDVFSLNLRTQERTSPNSNRFHTVSRHETWSPSETAVIVCDMWDLHHCLNATRRVGELAPRMNQVLHSARARGALIIHAPSSCMDPYEDHPARQRALAAPKAANLPKDIGQWCYQITQEEGKVYPIDQSDGGEDDDLVEHAQWAQMLSSMGRNPRAPWKSQTDTLTIENQDVISDNGEEIWNVLESEGIKNVILVGVHTNMCVLGRPFGLRQMAQNGKNVVLMRDMTDTMYNPGRAPYVSHFTGTDLIVEHIEKWVCPTITSNQLIGGKPFRFDKDRRRHLAIVMAEREYRTNESLPDFARTHLGADFRVSYVYANDEVRNELPGINILQEADLALISVRRRALPEQQMRILREFIEGGKPVVGVRTANHAFSLHNETPPEGLSTWESFDEDVWGGHYTGHHGTGPAVQLSPSVEMIHHAILQGVNLSDLEGKGSLYKVMPLKDSTTILLTGLIPTISEEPIAWTNVTRWGGRAFYTSLGHIEDFQQPAMNRLLKNAIYWAAEIPMASGVVAAK